MRNISLILSVLVLIVFMMFSCSSDEKKIAIIHGTSTDESEPWLNIREHDNSCSKTIGRLKDGTRVNILEENGDFVRVETIPVSGYVHKSYLTNLEQVHSTPEQTLLEISKNVINALRSDIKKVRQYAFQDSIDFFYWSLPVCEISNSNYRSLVTQVYNYDGELVTVTSKPFINFIDKVSTRYMYYKGTEYMPAAGFGGGTVSMPNKNVHTVTIGIDEGGYNSNEIWFLYRETDIGYSLIEIGMWEWTP